MLKVPLKNPKPNFEEFKKIIRGEKKAEKVHLIELLADIEIVNFITKNVLEEETIPWSPETKKGFLKQHMKWWYRMGHDYITVIIIISRKRDLK